MCLCHVAHFAGRGRNSAVVKYIFTCLLMMKKKTVLLLAQCFVMHSILFFSAVRAASWVPKVAWPKSVFTSEEEASDSKRPVRSNFCMSAHSKHSQVLTKKPRFLRLAFPLLSTLFVLLTTELHHFKISTI